MRISRFLRLGLIMTVFVACSESKQEKTEQKSADTAEQAISAEISSDVPELWDFHEVIYQIWHEAWPEKNTTMLTDLIPQIETGFTKLQAAKLPGILRHKDESWTAGIKEMATIIERYKEAAATGNKEALLKAAEELHTQFENLVRLIRPVMKEIDHFHQELYKVYHYYMPEFELEKIKSSTHELLRRMKPIDQVKLPDRLKEKQQIYALAKTELRKAVQDLSQKIEDTANEDQIKQAVEEVHDKYQSLIAVFEWK